MRWAARCALLSLPHEHSGRRAPRLGHLLDRVRVRRRGRLISHQKWAAACTHHRGALVWHAPQMAPARQRRTVNDTHASVAKPSGLACPRWLFTCYAADHLAVQGPPRLDGVSSRRKVDKSVALPLHSTRMRVSSHPRPGAPTSPSSHQGSSPSHHRHEPPDGPPTVPRTFNRHRSPFTVTVSVTATAAATASHHSRSSSRNCNPKLPPPAHREDPDGLQGPERREDVVDVARLRLQDQVPEPEVPVRGPLRGVPCYVSHAVRGHAPAERRRGAPPVCAFGVALVRRAPGEGPPAVCPSPALPIE